MKDRRTRCSALKSVPQAPSSCPRSRAPKYAPSIRRVKPSFKGREAIVNDQARQRVLPDSEGLRQPQPREVPGVLKAETTALPSARATTSCAPVLTRSSTKSAPTVPTTRSTPSGSAATSELLSESKAPADGFIRRALGLLVTLFRKVTGQLLRPWDWLLRKDRPDGRSRGNPSRRKLRFEPHHECRPRIHPAAKRPGIGLSVSTSRTAVSTLTATPPMQ